MRLVAYNIQYSKGQDGVYSIERIAEVVSACDIICLQEVECNVDRSGNIDQSERLAEMMPYHHWVYGPALDIDGSTVDSDGQVQRRRRSFGNMVMSRWPIVSTRTHLLPKTGSVTVPSMQRVAVEAVIDLGSTAIRVYSVHLDHVGSFTRVPQARALMETVRRGPQEGGAFSGVVKDDGWAALNGTPMPRAAIVMGDLNCAYDSPEYEIMIGPRSERHGRVVSPDGLLDAWVAAGFDEADGVSHQFGKRIDHCFVSTWLGPAVRSASIDTTQQASDHYPLFVELDEAAIPAEPSATDA